MSKQSEEYLIPRFVALHKEVSLDCSNFSSNNLTT